MSQKSHFSTLKNMFILFDWYVRGHSQLSTFSQAYERYARKEVKACHTLSIPKDSMSNYKNLHVASWTCLHC